MIGSKSIDHKGQNGHFGQNQSKLEVDQVDFWSTINSNIIFSFFMTKFTIESRKLKKLGLTCSWSYLKFVKISKCSPYKTLTCLNFLNFYPMVAYHTFLERLRKIPQVCQCVKFLKNLPFKIFEFEVLCTRHVKWWSCLPSHCLPRV